MTSSTEAEPLDEDWPGVTRGARLIKMDLGPLSREEALGLAAALANASPSLVARCVERAAGNPLFLTHLVYQASESTEASVPGSVQSLVQAQIDRLAPEHKEALQASAVLGPCFEAGALAHLLGGMDHVPEFSTADRLIWRRGDAFLFAHALIRDAIYDSLLKSRRRAMHRCASDWYADRDPVLYAEHLEHADDAHAAQAYLAAARSQAAEYRHEHALRLVERGLAVACKNADVFALADLKGDLLRDFGSMPAAAAAYQQALDAAGDCAQRCRAGIGLASVKRVTDDLEGAFADLDRAEREAATQGLLAEQARIHFLRGNLFVPRGQMDQCLTEHGRSLQLARQAGSPELEAAAFGGLGDAEYVRGRMISAHACFLRCIDLARRHGCNRIEVANRPMAALTQWYAGDADGALREALLAIEAAVRIRHRRAEMIAHHVAYFCRHAMGELEPACDNVERALALAQQLHARRFEAGLLAFRAELKRLAGRRSDALVDVTDALRISREAGMNFLGPVILAILALVTDNPEVRNAALAEGDTLLALGSLSRNQLQFRRDAIDACLHAGDWGRAEAYAAELEDYARGEPMPWTDYIVTRGRALASHGAGRSDSGLGTELLRLRDQGAGLGLGLSLPAIDAALEAMGSHCSA
jgi:tetratricopeptide (TPR) repeat protein